MSQIFNGDNGGYMFNSLKIIIQIFLLQNAVNRVNKYTNNGQGLRKTAGPCI